MCLGIPARIVEIVEPDAQVAKAELSGVRRRISLALCPEAGVGDWVLVHVGFALSKIDEEQAAQTIDALVRLGEAYEQEVHELRQGSV
jgi:hydrogenase expression/formation protein HypC